MKLLMKILALMQSYASRLLLNMHATVLTHYCPEGGSQSGGGRRFPKSTETWLTRSTAQTVCRFCWISVPWHTRLTASLSSLGGKRKTNVGQPLIDIKMKRQWDWLYLDMSWWCFVDLLMHCMNVKLPRQIPVHVETSVATKYLCILVNG